MKTKLLTNLFILLSITLFGQQSKSLNIEEIQNDILHRIKSDYTLAYTSQNSSLHTKSTLDLVQRLDEMLSEGWNTETETYENTSRTEYTYESDVFLESIQSNWDLETENWVANSKSEYIREAGILTEILEYDWDADLTAWVNKSKTEYTYEDGLLAQNMIYTWDADESVWVNSSKVDTLYDTGLITEQIIQTWNTEIGHWEYTMKALATYNDEDILIELLVQQFTDDWEDYLKLEYVYTDGDLTDFDYHLWYSGMWIHIIQTSFLYDTAFTFSNLLLPDLTFDQEPMFNHKLDVMEMEMVDVGGEWNNLSKNTYTYSEQEITSTTELSENDLSIYPNPFNKKVTFSISEDISNFSLLLSDSLGRKILSKEMHNGDSLDMENLENGVYFYSIIVNDKTLNGKLIKE